MKQSRRKFLQTSSLAASAAGFYPWVRAAAGAPFGPAQPDAEAAGILSTRSPNEQISFGVIGCNGMGYSDTRSLLKIPDVRCLALCDVDESVLARRVKDVAEIGGITPATYRDYRRLLENPDLDFVVIGTPDHWHCLMMVHALEAGKHVYVEKPLANSIHECDVMLRAADRHERIVQLGQWQRSGPHWRQAVDFVQSGQLGKIRTVKTWAYQGWMKPVPILADSAVPTGVDYDMWLGPAASRPFNKNRFHFNFRWFWDYAGGLMTDWGVHIVDYALYGMNAGYPKSVMASGGKFAYPDDASETPDTLQAIFEFDDFTMIWEHATGIDLGPYGRTHGVAFIGNNGTLIVDRAGWEVIAEDEPGSESGTTVLKMDPPEPVTREGSDLDRHTQNFIAALRGNESVNAGIEVGHKAAVVAHMGNIAFKSGQKIFWNDGRFGKNDKANLLIQPRYRAPWYLPIY